MSYYSRTFTTATASTVPASVSLPDALNERWEALKAYPVAQRQWNGCVSDATVKKWLMSKGLPRASVSVCGAHKGQGVTVSRRIVEA